MLPGLLRELHALYVTDPEHRADVLRALKDCYQITGVLLKNLGVRGLPVLASFRAQQVAEELDDPAWLGLAAWVRGFTLGGKGRPRMLELSVQGADALENHLDDPRAQQMYGALHLNAALASAVMCRSAASADHLNEAATMADRIGGTGRGFGTCTSGRTTSGSGGSPSRSSSGSRVARARLPGMCTRHGCRPRPAKRSTGPTWAAGWRSSERPVTRRWVRCSARRRSHRSESVLLTRSSGRPSGT